MLTRIDSYELTEWMSYLNIENKEREKDQKQREAESKTPDNKPATFGNRG